MNLSIETKAAIGFAGVLALFGLMGVVSWQHISTGVRIGIGVGGCLAVGVVGWAWWLIRQDSRGRRRAEDLLRLANDQLETGVRDRTAALSRSLASLTESEARLAGIISSAMDGIITMDQEFRIVLFNQAAEKIFQRRAADLIGQPFNQLLPERFRATYVEQMGLLEDTSVLGQSPNGQELKFGLRANGEEFPMETSISQLQAGSSRLYTVILRDITERTLTEQHIRYQFQLLESITERAAECIFVTDLEGRVTFANPEVEKVFGFPLREIMGEVLHEKIHHHHPDGRPFPATECGLECARDAHESVRNQELVFFRRDGSPVPTLGSTAPLEVAGHTVGLVLVARDITDLKNAESALRASNAQLEAAQELAGMGSFDADLGTQSIVWSRPANRLLGFNAARSPATLGEFLEFIHPADRGLFGDPAPDWAQSARAHAFDFRSNPGRGPVRHFAAMIDLTDGAPGRPAGCKGTILDVTQRKLAEAAVRESEERLRQIAASLRDAIWLVDAQTQRVLYVNPAFETICGRTRDDFYRDADVFNQLIHPEDRDRILRANAQGTPSGDLEERHRIIRPDGSIRWVQGRTVAVKNEAGETYRIASILEDVTRRVEAENLQRSLEAQLRQAQKMDAIGTLAGGIAHDFNNVLAGILGSVELARMEIPPDHPSQQFLQSILTASNRARELIQQILAFSRRKDSERTLLHLQPVVTECVKLLRSTIPAMVRITWRVQNACPPVLADPVQIHQVIMNICTNAWHALPPADGHIDLAVQVEHVSEAEADRHADLRAGTYVCLIVKDNGHGMDLATQQRIFEPFFTTKPSGKGTGLGLSVAHGIIRAHQGAIVVRSAPGKGAAFSVYLPAQAMAAAAEPAKPKQLPKGRGERILFVDDEQNLAVITEKVLTRSGYTVTRFDRAERALEKFRETPLEFDLAITDLAMPGMSGMDLATALLQVRADLPILLVSGFVDQPVREAAQAVGVREVLLKPLSIDGLSDAVSRALAGGKASPPA